jgi:hypothetical protein
MDTESTPSPTPVSSPRSAASRRWTKRGLGLFGLAAVVAGSWYLTSRHGGGLASFGSVAVDSNARLGAKERVALSTLTDEVARQSVTTFLATAEPSERASLVLDSDYYRPIMESFYAGRSIDAMTAADFEPMTLSLEAAAAPVQFLKRTRAAGLSPIVAAVVSTPAGPRLDWGIWRQTEENLFESFVTSVSEHTARLRVVLTGAKDELWMQDAFNPESRARLPHSASPELAKLYREVLPFGKSRLATLIVAWGPDSATGGLALCVRDHVCWGLEGIDATPMERPELAPAVLAEAASEIGTQVPSGAAAPKGGTVVKPSAPVATSSTPKVER